jgi:hypothetical protein
VIGLYDAWMMTIAALVGLAMDSAEGRVADRCQIMQIAMAIIRSGCFRSFVTQLLLSRLLPRLLVTVTYAGEVEARR